MNEFYNDWKYAIWAVFAGAFLIILSFTFGINEIGKRTVIRYPSGAVIVKFDSGPYFQGFGSVEEYSDVITYDFPMGEVLNTITLPVHDDPSNPQASTHNQVFNILAGGLSVRYQDGGTGQVFGIARFNLPSTEEQMIELHRTFKSERGVLENLIKPVVAEATRLTAGLMTSEEAYAEKRNMYSLYSRDQIDNGKYVTQLREKTVDVPSPDGKEVRKETRIFQEIVTENGVAKHEPSDLRKFGITISSYQLTDWDFEPKTLMQINTKRQATMAIITAIAVADRAKQDAITAEQTGLADVMRARYEKEVEKAREIVDAEKRVALAVQAKLEAEQAKLQAIEYKAAQEYKGQGDAAYKKAVMVADGALAQKLDAWVRVNELYADAISKQRWVPEIQMGSSGTPGASATSLVDLLTAKTAKDLSLDLKTSTQQ